ncbi:MAG: adenylate/guanylate cyclase domain-containing protein [Thaumarchaeota archaeon]|nr:adenylate/guanylate cyclase domain-containing protein [Nitrososphaerota archaeon]
MSKGSTQSASTDQQLETELNEVTYAIINIGPSKSTADSETVHRISSAINVRLYLEGEQDFPFVPFDNFDNLQNEEKIFLYGSSGSGKSRALFELVKKSIENTRRIYIINPRNNVGDESGRVPLRELVDKMNADSVIVWDNFPDDLTRRDMANTKNVLELLSSKNVGKIIVVLKPRYLEVFRDLQSQIPEFFVHEITYSNEQFKKIIQQYGTSIPQFRKLYERYIFSKLDKISRILWSREPTPLTVFDYYNELKSKDNEMSGNLDSVKEAENMLRRTNYYQHQFGLLSGMGERKSDAEFLCVLKMCYELGIDRTEYNISLLQHSIFGSDSPKAAFNKLGNWFYISGQQYAMHDVCREAVKLSNYVKMKMLSYISENNTVIEWGLNQAVNLLGLFIGRNIQFVSLRDSSNGFLSNNIYNRMKENAVLEKSIGIGVGEIFQMLDDELRNTVLNRCDTDLIFGMGMAEGLTQSFIFLDPEQRNLVLQRIYGGFLFARFFGKTLGLLLKDLDQDIRNEILPHIESNSQFADGIGMGIGQVLDLLDVKIREDITERAKQNIALTRGLGFALASNIGSLDKNQRKQIYAKTENDFQYDVGLAFGMAAQYTTMPKEVQAEALSRCGDHNGFAKGFGLYLMLYTLDKCPPEVLALVDKNGELAFSLGFGFGWVFPYLPPEFQSWAKSRSKDNNRFERGVGFGSGLILRHLPQTHRKNLFTIADTKSEFDYGLGSGIAFTWNYQSTEDKNAAYARCNTNGSFAQGLGYGHGYAFHYLSEDERSQTFQIAQSNSQFDGGLGYGLGWSFPYSDEILRNKMLERTKTNNIFAFGLGNGLGQLYRYLSTKTRLELFSHADENGWFARGLGAGLGRYAMEYLEKELQDKIFSRAVDNPEFALGLGEGFGQEFRFFSDEFKRRVLGVVPQSTFFARGIGTGFGLSLEYVSPEFQHDMYKRAKENIHFAIGLGEGIAMIFQYLDDLQRKEILAKAIFDTNIGLSRGFGTGLGRIISFLTNDFCNEMLLQRATENSQLAMGLGKGTGSIFAYLSASFQNKLLELSEENIHFAIGLGDGIGNVIFEYLTAEVRNDLLHKAQENWPFAMGLGIGIGTSFKYYESRQELQHKIISNISLNSSMTEGFGIGIGIVYQYLSEQSRRDIIKLAEQNVHFARAFGFSQGHIPSTIKSVTIKPFVGDFPQNPEIEYGLGAGAGHNFPFLDVETQGQILNKAMTVREFGRGFGTGLAKSFRLLDKILEKEILRQASDKDEEFSYSLGYGLGNTFTSINEDLQKELLKIVKDKNLFSRGFTAAISRSKEYLEKDSLMQISELVEQENSSEVGSRDQKPLVEYHNAPASLENYFLYDYFVGTDLASPLTSLQSSMFSKEEVTFSGERKKFCVCVLDMISSTKVASQLDKTQLSKYYSIFLNSMATIVKNFNGKIIKNTGDGLAYYFPDTANPERDTSKFRDVLECSITMIAARTAINSRMQEENLPPINYRISVDYGLVEVVKSQSSQSEDLYGSTMNVCAKINGKALPNGMIVGDDLYKAVQHLAEEYTFSLAGKIDLGLANRNEYPVYHMEKKPGKNILQPFKHKPL